MGLCGFSLFLLMWTAKEKLLKVKGRQICFTSILWYSTRVELLFSLMLEFLYFATFPAVGDISAFGFVI